MATAASTQADDPQADDYQAAEDFAQRLRAETAAVRVRRRVLGNTRSLDAQRREEIAEKYHADPDYIRARKVLLNRKDPRIRDCFSICDRAIKYWESLTVPYSHTERGVRLIRRDRIDEFERGMQELLDELSEAVAKAEQAYQTEILVEARARLAELFDPSDYPPTLEGAWGFDWEFPNLDPPDYLQRLNPALYEHEQNRIRRRFEQAVELTEQAFAAEFSKMIEKLAERLAPGADGKVKTFQASTVDNLQEFFARFGQLNIGSNADLEALVEEAQAVVGGTNVAKLRKDAGERQTVGEAVAAISERLEGMMVDRPDREISLEDSDE